MDGRPIGGPPEHGSNGQGQVVRYIPLGKSYGVLPQVFMVPQVDEGTGMVQVVLGLRVIKDSPIIGQASVVEVLVAPVARIEVKDLIRAAKAVAGEKTAEPTPA